MCHAVTFSHVAPVYVSTLTLTAIAIGKMTFISRNTFLKRLFFFQSQFGLENLGFQFYFAFSKT